MVHRGIAAVALLIGHMLCGSDTLAQNQASVHGNCNIVIQGSNNKLAINGAQCPVWLPPKLSANKPLYIDGLLEFSGTTNKLEYPGKIVFRKGGSIRVRNGATLTISATTVEAEKDAKIAINAQGEPGRAGNPGRDGNGGVPGQCRARAEAYEDGRPSWPTKNKKDWIDANVSCDSSDAGRSCDYGLPGEDSPKGGPGGSVNLDLKMRPKGALDINVSGGPEGSPGAGGKGSRHLYKVGDKVIEQHDCPSGANGSSKANPGHPGACKISATWGVVKKWTDCN